MLLILCCVVGCLRLIVFEWCNVGRIVLEMDSGYVIDCNGSDDDIVVGNEHDRG